jgi:hypothetical protein
MTNAILPVVGGVAGFLIGGPVGALMGANLGSAANNLFLPGKKQRVKLPAKEGARLGDLRVQISSYGHVIPKVYGYMRLSGNVIWATDIKEVVQETVEEQAASGGGKGGGGRKQVITSQSTITYSYYVSLAIAICEGEVAEVSRFWADSMLLTEELLASGQGKFNIHLGTEDQLPDDIIGRHKQPGTYPAYRGLCYVVFEDFPLEQFGNRIPNFTFEVRRCVRFKPAVEDKIKEVVLIPGAGEFVYGEQIYTKQKGWNINHQFRPCFLAEYVNMHNYANKANMLLALEQMGKTLPNLEWVAVVVSWFATSSNAGNCRIVPKVEFHDANTRITPGDWQVAGLTRSTASAVLRFDEHTPTYGGTPSDETVIAICRQLKDRGYKVMLYPMIFVDEIHPSPKPWRGRIKAASATEIASWFQGQNGYNRFIMHYANLVRDYTDAFIIGSELIGLTSFADSAGSYPAVKELINLAGQVKRTLGNKLVTYAADWSEYHHTAGGWFNLDPLWASPDIDFVGIDAYFPLTEDSEQKQITAELIKQGWQSGEGWDYYCNGDRTEKRSFATDSPSTPHKYAWKNLEHWWITTHQNPDGSTTAWQPKMKPIWFTEFGFPSVDGCSNQPNVFYDPNSVESYFPRGSKGRIDFYAQRQALNATLDYLEERCQKHDLQNLVPKRFVWTYDARPFPFWPDFRTVWQDGNLWATGHWINGKLGISSLGAIIAELLEATGLEPADYDVSRLTDDVSGYIITDHITAREAIEQLQSAYFFDAVESDGILKFVPRSPSHNPQTPITSITEEELVPNNNGDILETLELNIAQELELPQKISLSYIDRAQNYDLVTVEATRQVTDTREQVNFSLPIVLSNSESLKIAEITLYNAWQERINYQLTLPPKYAYLEPTDIIEVKVRGVSHRMRIIKADMVRSGMMKVVAVSFNMVTYDFYRNTNYLLPSYELPKPISDTIMELIDAPPLPNDEANAEGILRIAVTGSSSNWQGAAIYQSIDNNEDYRLLGTAAIPSIAGVSLEPLPPASPLIFDYGSTITVQLFAGTLTSVTESALLNGVNAALIGDELIQFQKAELIGNNRYALSKLLRGRQGSEWAIDTHKAGESFILLNSRLITCKLSSELIGKAISYKAVSIGKTLAEVEPVTFIYNAKRLKPFAPVSLRTMQDSEGNICISWIRRSRINNSWWNHADVPLGEEQELYQIEIRSGDTLLRAIEANIPSYIYSREQQTADFGNKIPKRLTVTVFQLSAQIGKGYGASINLHL